MAGLTPKRWKTKAGAVKHGHQVSWYDAAGKRRFKRYSGPGALAKAKTKFKEVTGLAKVRGAGTTVRAASAAFVDHVKLELRRSRATWDRYDQQFDQHINPAMVWRGEGPQPEDDPGEPFGDILVAELSGPDCEALKSALLRDKGVDLTIRLMRTLRTMLRYCVRKGWAASNPADAARVERVDRGEDKVEYPEKHEIQALLDAVSRPAPAAPGFAEVWIRTAMITGMRPSELRGAAIEDLVLVGPKPGIHVRRAADEWRQIGLVKTKNARRFIPVGPGLVDLWRRWLMVVPRGRSRKNPATKTYELLQPTGVADPENPGRRIHLLFPTSDGTVQSLPNIFNRVWAPAALKAEIIDMVPVVDKDGNTVWQDAKRKVPMLRAVPRYPINCLRHFAASLMIEDGLNEKQLQMRMGHSSVKVTLDLYGHLFGEQEADTSSATRIEAQFK